MFHDVRARTAGSEKRNILESAECRADHEFKPGGADGNDASDGLSAVEHDDGLTTADGLEVLAEVGFEVGCAYGSHDHMIVRHVLDVNHGRRRHPKSPGSLSRPSARRGVGDRAIVVVVEVVVIAVADRGVGAGPDRGAPDPEREDVVLDDSVPVGVEVQVCALVGLAARRLVVHERRCGFAC